MEIELPSYSDIIFNDYKYFKNPQYRFNTFYKCTLLLQYPIHDYVKSGFFLKSYNKIICYNCGLEDILHIGVDPCLIHHNYKKTCIYSSKRTYHNHIAFLEEVYLIVLIMGIILFLCILIVCIYYT